MELRLQSGVTYAAVVELSLHTGAQRSVLGRVRGIHKIFEPFRRSRKTHVTIAIRMQGIPGAIQGNRHVRLDSETDAPSVAVRLPGHGGAGDRLIARNLVPEVDQPCSLRNVEPGTDHGHRGAQLE